ncbi:MAG: sigma-E processing peptidase SpoIIGA [Clostridia bacterium]|nr:sigma-E processing peptidase SpoIIGA [Clostridia bacterium]
MEIYIEIFILQNILINFCLLKLVYLTTKSKTNFFKLFLASLVGTIPSVVVIMFFNNNFLLSLTKITTAFLMLMLAFKQTKKQFTFNFILLFLYTYTFGGIITSLSSSVYHTSFGMVMTSKFSLELICILFIIFTYIFELVVKHLKLKINTNNLLFNCILTQANNSIKINAYLDTGNFLNHNGQPVLILDLNAYLKLTNTNLINFLTQKTNTISTSTVSGNSNLKIFNIEKVELKNDKNTIKLTNQLVAVNTTNLFKNTNYQALLSPLFL